MMITTDRPTLSTVTDSISINCEPDDIINCIWDLRILPQIVPHVETVEILETGSSVQRFKMVLRSGDQRYYTESRRERVGTDRIVYVQSRPPRVLEYHEGDWIFIKTGPGQTRVQLQHRFRVSLTLAQEVLKVTEAAAEPEVAKRVGENGRATLEAYKRFLERNAQPT